MKLGKVTLYVNDQDEAIKFWTEQMGFEVKVNNEMGPNFKWVEVGNKDEFTNIVLYNKAAMQQQNPNTCVETPSLLFSTTDIDAKYEEMTTVGVKVDELQKMPYGSMFIFYDQDGQSFVMREDK